VVVKGFADLAPEQDWTRKLYQAAAPSRRVPITAVPYYAWDQPQTRRDESLATHFALRPPAGGLEARATVKVSFANDNSQSSASTTVSNPRAAANNPQPFAIGGRTRTPTSGRNTPANGPSPSAVRNCIGSTTRAAAAAASRRPGASNTSPAPTGNPSRRKATTRRQGQVRCAVTFEPVTTTALRMTVTLPKDGAAGAHEWRVVEAEED